MPRKDGTGPQGQGSKTGRGLGPCNSFNQTSVPPGQGGLGFSRGIGMGRGRGLGRGVGRGQGRGRGRR